MLGRVLDHNDGCRGITKLVHLSEQMKANQRYTIYSADDLNRARLADGQ